MSSLNYADMARLIRKGRRAERFAEARNGCIAQQIASAFGYLFRGWMLMLTVGILHHDWLASLPTLGYWQSVLIVILMAGVFSVMPKVKEATQ